MLTLQEEETSSRGAASPTLTHVWLQAGPKFLIAIQSIFTLLSSPLELLFSADSQDERISEIRPKLDGFRRPQDRPDPTRPSCDLNITPRTEKQLETAAAAPSVQKPLHFSLVLLFWF